MKHLITIIGPNAVGKSTTAVALLNSCPRSAYVDSDCLRATNPFPFTAATQKAVAENIYCILKNFLLCEDIDTVIFPYSFHGERKDMFEEVVRRLEEENIQFKLHYIILKCSEEENIRRAVCDGRDKARIQRGMQNTFHFYDEYDYPTIDTTGLKPEQVAEEIMRMVLGTEVANLYLHIPKLDELWYRQQLMSDPDTMNYNIGYEPFDGYDAKTGCIAFPESDWSDWYEYFIGNEPSCFYAYIVRKEDNAFIGEVNLHKSTENDWHEMGIVLDAKYRGRGYSVEALKLLVQYGFEKMHVKAIHNMFEIEREAAVHTHLAAGFEVLAKNDIMVELIITNNAERLE